MSSLAVAKSPGLLGLQEAARMPCCDRAGDLFMYNSMVAGRILAVRGIMSFKPEEVALKCLHALQATNAQRMMKCPARAIP